MIDPEDAGPSQQYVPLPASLGGASKGRTDAERHGKVRMHVAASRSE